VTKGLDTGPVLDSVEFNAELDFREDNTGTIASAAPRDSVRFNIVIASPTP